jgi:ferrochelatase
MPKEGIKKVLVVCPAFVSDCLETIEEMGEEGKEIFLHAGGENFQLIPCLNVHPLWISTMAKWVEDYVAGDTTMLLDPSINMSR